MKADRIMTLALLTGLLISLISCIRAPEKSPVKAWEGTITIPTYGWEDDVNPKFWAMEAGVKGSTTVRVSIIYPYTMQDHLSKKLTDVTYKALFLENEYIKVTCLPELGGRLHSVLDKTTNREVFHKNSVIKPGMIAMRGAFISGGVEWNAGPQVHTVTVVSPVDALIGRNSDGSAYIEINNLEKSLRTNWTVRVTLKPGKSCLEEDIRMSNPTDAMNPYYFWNCTAFPQLPGTRFIYPMRLGTDHYGVRFFRWPVNEGVDLSWTKNYRNAASIFAVNAAFDFFGAYDADLDRGVVQVANHNEHSGKKAWTWGQGEYGRVSQLSLTDNDGNYIEVQSGPLPTQSDYGMFAPGSSISWKEFWYPVHGLGEGFEFACEKAAFQAVFTGDSLELRIISTEKIKGAECSVSSDDSVLHTVRTDLSPLSASIIKVYTGSSRKVTVRLAEQGGSEIAKFQAPLQIPDFNPPAPPSYTGKAVEDMTAGELYLMAQKYDRSLDRINARKTYELVLKRDNHHPGALRDLAILDFESGLYEKAAEGFRLALKQVPNDDGLAWYFLGLCRIKQNDLNEAIRCGFKASRCQGTVAIGYDLAGTGYMLGKDYTNAAHYFEKAGQSNQDDQRIAFHIMLARYAGGDKNEARRLAADRTAKYPSELVPRFLTAILDKNTESKVHAMREFIGEDDFQLMEASNIFSNLGLADEAITVLESGAINNVPDEKQNQLVLYRLGYLHSLKEDNEKAAEYLKRGSGTSRDFVFASRPEDEEALKYALSENPGDAAACFQLGNLYGNYGRLDEAAVLWNRAVSVNPSLSIPWRNLALYYCVVKEDYSMSEKCYKNAILARPDDQTLYRDYTAMLADNGRRDEAIALLENMQVTGMRRSDITIDLAQYYLEEKRFDESAGLLRSTPYFVNWEGSSITWDIFSRANMGRGIKLYDSRDYMGALAAFDEALSFPENLGVGKEDYNGVAKAWYWKGRALSAMERSAEAKDAWKSGSEVEGGSKEQNEYIELCRSLSRREF
jgi:tetratricopeptide (TPR) repeat protein